MAERTEQAARATRSGSKQSGRKRHARKGKPKARPTRKKAEQKAVQRKGSEGQPRVRRRPKKEAQKQQVEPQRPAPASPVQAKPERAAAAVAVAVRKREPAERETRTKREPNWDLLGFVVTTGFLGGGALALWWWLCPKGQPALGFGAGGGGGPGFGFGGRGNGEPTTTPVFRLPELPAPPVKRPTPTEPEPIEVEDGKPPELQTTRPVPVPDPASSPAAVRQAVQGGGGVVAEPGVADVSVVIPSPDAGPVRTPRAAVIRWPGGGEVEVSGWDVADPEPSGEGHARWAARVSERLVQRIREVVGDNPIRVVVYTNRPEDLVGPRWSSSTDRGSPLTPEQMGLVAARLRELPRPGSADVYQRAYRPAEWLEAWARSLGDVRAVIVRVVPLVPDPAEQARYFVASGPRHSAVFRGFAIQGPGVFVDVPGSFDADHPAEPQPPAPPGFDAWLARARAAPNEPAMVSAPERVRAYYTDVWVPWLRRHPSRLTAGLRNALLQVARSRGVGDLVIPESRFSEDYIPYIEQAAREAGWPPSRIHVRPDEQVRRVARRLSS